MQKSLHKGFYLVISRNFDLNFNLMMALENITFVTRDFGLVFDFCVTFHPSIYYIANSLTLQLCSLFYFMFCNLNFQFL